MGPFESSCCQRSIELIFFFLPLCLAIIAQTFAQISYCSLSAVILRPFHSRLLVISAVLTTLQGFSYNGRGGVVVLFLDLDSLPFRLEIYYELQGGIL